MDDSLSFIEEDIVPEGTSTEPKKKWKVMIVDDEEEVHAVTKIALSDFEYLGRSIEFLDAHSGKEAKEMIKNHPDTAIMLLDVVMESDHSGLDVAKYIRDEVHNELVRIILRTGQPGQAPERDVILNYDINDYKTKTELTSQKLFTIIVASIRSYNHIKKLDTNKKGLEKIINASNAIFEIDSIDNFVDGVLLQIVSLLDFKENSVYANSYSAVATDYNGNDIEIIAGTGEFATLKHQNAKTTLPQSVISSILEAIEKKESIFKDDVMVIYFSTKTGSKSIIYLECEKKISDFNKNLLVIFCKNISVAFEKIYAAK